MLSVTARIVAGASRCRAADLRHARDLPCDSCARSPAGATLGRMGRILAACVLMWCAVAAADVKTAKNAKVTVTTPKGYKVEAKDDNVLRGESADKAVAVFVWTVDTTDLDAAQKMLAGELYSSVAALKWDKPRTAKVHGLPAQFFEGSGRAVGAALDIEVVLVGPTSTKKGVIVMAAVDHEKRAAHQAEIDAMLKSVTPLK